ncbi:aminotransferase class III-fold pyridoxal phosphate-dependent enzyme [Methanosarcina sp. 2.H.A.1B.4]|uniref:aminotransferase class III-fold pyridoxal phosphate-dependent enzyme n=1 Tax=Methanosarcina sp. 2.H.A.1B.4 TaxID=1483600 RepID=UPI0006217550|nr:aspartate aminotransferase family protein [Methanosarcina sp. 2.H.A.1B.4]KKG10204.1 acetylornithine aminotransferase [Methanosarcina sp. 2.H.A.1B.4]
MRTLETDPGFFEQDIGLLDMVGPKAREIIGQDCNVISACVARPYPLVVDRANGSIVKDIDGKEYIDFVAGIAVMNAGYSNPEVKAAISAQLDKMFHCGYGDFFAEPPLKLAKKLRELAGYSKVFYCNSGTEAVEAAMKLALWKTKRQNFISFYNAFHGRTLGALSLTCSKVRQKEYFPTLRTVHTHYAYCYRCPMKLEYPSCGIECAKQIENLIFRKELSPEDTAAVFTEPIQGEGGYIVPPPEFHKEVRKICTDNDVLLVADEVQTGCFRTGPFLAMENFEVRADITCLAKALGGGLPMGAMLADRNLMDWPPGVHSNTFGGNLLSSAASLASLEFLEKENIENHVREMGAHIRQRLRELQENFPCIGDVRGLGLMIGAEIVKSDKSIDPIRRDRIIREAFKEGVILLPCGDSVIRFSPPLVMTDEEADLGLDKFEKSLRKAAR